MCNNITSGRKDYLYYACEGFKVILTSAKVLAKGTKVLDGTVISADFHDIRNCETFSDVQFAGCAFRKNIRLAGSTFENCVFYNCSFSCDFFDCKFINCKFARCTFWPIEMTSIILESSKIIDSEFLSSTLMAITGGEIADSLLHFCKLQEFETELRNCKLVCVSINGEESISS